MKGTASSVRRARERVAVRRRIVQTSLQLVEEEGAAALTMRRVAQEMGYTAPVVYQHFESKDALVLELVTHGYALLTTALGELPTDTDPDRRLSDAAVTYVRFAGEHPHLFDAMNVEALDAEQRRAIVEPVVAVLDDLLGAWASHHQVHLGDRVDACDVVWGTLYGLGALGRLETMGNARAQRLTVLAITTILDGWRSR